MNIYRLLLKSAADCFYNHRGEEFTLCELNEKYNSKYDAMSNENKNKK